MSEPFTAERVTYLRPRRALAASALAVVGGPVLFWMAVLTHTSLLAGIAPLVCVLGVVGASAWFANRWPGRARGRVVAGEEGVFFDGRLLSRREEIKAGVVVPKGLGPPAVRLERRWRPPIDLEVADEAEGRALLRALGLDASQTVATFQAPSRMLTERQYRAAFVVGVIGLGFLSGFLRHSFHGAAWTFVRLGFLMGLVAFSMLTRSRIDVGADGILTSWLGVQRRFIPYREIAGVAPYADTTGGSNYRYRGVLVSTVQGEEIRVPVAQTTATDSRDRANAVLERIREAMAAYQKGDATASAAMLDRGGRDVAAWIRALRAVGSGAAADHRTAPVLPEQLWRIVEDPSEKPELRAGAAVVLGGSLDEGARARLRAAAGAVAEPEVRVAIEAAGAEDEEALAEALAALPQEGRARAG